MDDDAFLMLCRTGTVEDIVNGVRVSHDTYLAIQHIPSLPSITVPLLFLKLMLTVRR